MTNGNLSATEVATKSPSDNPQVISRWVIQGDSFSLWKQNIKDSTLTCSNIYVEGVDNILDAGSSEGYIRIKTYSDSHIISQLNLLDYGCGMSEEIVKERFFKFPITTYDYDSSSIGANGYGIKGISMRLGSLKTIITKTVHDTNFRMYTVKFLDKDGNSYEPGELNQYEKQTNHSFFKHTYMIQDIVAMEITETIVDSSYVATMVNRDFAGQSSGTFISIHGMPDNGVKLTAKDQETVSNFAKLFYGNVDRLNMYLAFGDGEYNEVKPMRYPVDGYPHSIRHLNKFDDIVVDSSGNEYKAYYMYNLSETHQPDEIESYESVVNKSERFINMDNNSGNPIRRDGQVITVLDNNMRAIGCYMLKGNGQFYGGSHNGMNIFLVSKRKLKNLDRFKFLGFANKEEIKSIRTSIKNILSEDLDNQQVYKNPLADKDKRDEVAQTEDLFDKICQSEGSYLDRWMEHVTDYIEDVKVKASSVKDTSNYNISLGQMGNGTDSNQIDSIFYPDGNTPSVIVEVENRDTVSTKSHLEKVNMWYDEIVQMGKEPVEWIVWIAKRHTFERRLKALLDSKPSKSKNFKGFILMNWKDFYRKDGKSQVKYVTV